MIGIESWSFACSSDSSLLMIFKKTSPSLKVVDTTFPT